MQTILHQYTNDNTIFRQIDALYKLVSSETPSMPRLFPKIYDSSFEELFDILENKVAWFVRPETENLPIPKLNYEVNNTDIVVCVSGGKDSVATAKHYMNLGFNVYLYHLHGINKVYYDEYKCVEQIAKYLDLPYKIDECVIQGTQDFVEHPLKNYIIANSAIDWAISNRIAPNIAFGNFSASRVDDNPFDVCGGDCLEMWLAYNKIIQKIIPTFRLKLPLTTQKDTIDIIMQDRRLVELSQSCISPYRFREHWKKRTEDKYHINLLEHRCGCCWKCAVEYITFADIGIFEFNEPYYIHCLEILGKTMQKESDMYEIPVINIWSEYISHNIKYSKIKDKITNGIIQNGKAKFEK